MPAILDKIAAALHLKPATPTTPATTSPATTSPATTSPAATSPVFDSTKVTVVFVLGGPGAGKGTQCAKLVEDFGFCHLSAGDLLRAEQTREGSQYGKMISDIIKDGRIVPMEVTVKLLEQAMTAAVVERSRDSNAGDAWANGKGRFLIDGFPRKMDQAEKFEETVCVSSMVLFFTTTEEVMLQRLLIRGLTSGREDDNEESIKKRFTTYHSTTMPVIEHYNKIGKVVEVDSSAPVEEVYAKAKAVIAKLFNTPEVVAVAEPAAVEPTPAVALA